jgi:peptide deformylase
MPAQDGFVAELRRRRDVAGLSQVALAGLMGYGRSYVSKVETSGEAPSQEFAAKADQALHAGGTLVAAWQEQFADRRGQAITAGGGNPDVGAAGLLVLDDDAELVYELEPRQYRATMRRRIRNVGTEPITRYLIRISVDRYPGDAQRSNLLYREDPLRWEDIHLHAWHGEHRGQPMRWHVKVDRDAVKEVWLEFAAADGSRFPLYPGQDTAIEYTYTVPQGQWGHGFQRAVRLPTRRLSVQLAFPAALRPTVWGLHTSMAAESSPLPTPIAETLDGENAVYRWSTTDPPLHARYRLEWTIPDHAQDPSRRPSERMAALGVLQQGHRLLTQPARRFDLPAEADDARRLIAELRSVMARVGTAHQFAKGMGIAAPQIGVARAAAVVRTAAGDEITLLNPTIIESSEQTDSQYEGCLSFFDVRGQVPRSLTIQVEHADIDGRRHITQYEHGVARLVAHEVDHLHGHLYLDRMPPGTSPIPVEQYRGTGQAWRYRQRP